MVVQADLQAAFVLHHRPFRNTSVIADLLTPDYGRIDVIARGARSAKSSRRPLLQPFRPLLASWTGRAELKTLTKLEESGQLLSLTGDALAYAYYVSELALRLIARGQPNVQAFALYAQTLSTLAGSEVNGLAGESVLRAFELELLDSLGLLPDFSACEIEGAAIVTDTIYQFDSYSGQATTKSIAQNSVTVSGATLLAMHSRNFKIDGLLDANTLLQAKRLMRQLLRVHLGSQPLKSREVFKQLQRGK